MCQKVHGVLRAPALQTRISAPVVRRVGDLWCMSNVCCLLDLVLGRQL